MGIRDELERARERSAALSREADLHSGAAKAHLDQALAIMGDTRDPQSLGDAYHALRRNPRFSDHSLSELVAMFPDLSVPSYSDAHPNEYSEAEKAEHARKMAASPEVEPNPTPAPQTSADVEFEDESLDPTIPICPECGKPLDGLHIPHARSVYNSLPGVPDSAVEPGDYI